MKRPLFLLVIGLVLGEAVVLLFGWKGGLLPISLFLFIGIYFCGMHSGNHILQNVGFGYDSAQSIVPEQSFFRKIFLHEQRKLGSSLLLLFIAISVGFTLSLYAFMRKEPVDAFSLPAHGKISGKILFLKTSQEGKYTITLHSVLFLSEGEDSWRKVKGNCRISNVSEEDIALLPGDWILCEGSLEKLGQPTNPGEFNSEVYYRSNGISCQCFAESCRWTAKEKISLRRAAYRFKEKMEQVYQTVLSPEKAALLKAMVLGDKSDLSDEQKRIYEENGAAHLLAVSGLHVSIAAGLWYRFLRKRKVRYIVACMSGGFLLLFYGCMTGFGNSVTRATIMYGIYLGSEYAGTDYDTTSAMSLAAMLMLMESPWRLLEGGFQISFAAILALGYILPWVSELCEKRTERAKNGNRTIEKNVKKGNIFPWKIDILDDGQMVCFPEIKKKIHSTLLASLVITGVTLPVLLHVFFEFCPYSIFLNLILIPAMTPLMLSAMAAGLVGMLWLAPASVFCLPAQGILTFFDLVFAFVRQLPGALVVTGCPSLWQMMAIYCLEGVFVYCWYHRLWKRYCCGMILASLLFFCFRPGSTLFIVMLDVGQGDGIYLHTPGGESILIDGGSSSRKNVGQYVIEPALKYYGEDSLDYVIVTHGDADHISGIQELFEMGYPIEHLLLQEGQEDDEALHLLTTQAVQAGTEVLYVGRGDRIEFSEMTMTCCHPYSGFPSDDRNAASLVFHLNYVSFDALFTGDLEETGEMALCQWLSQNRVFSGELELLKVAHHGSRYSTSEEFLSLTEPKLGLISAGRDNLYGHPHQELLDRLYRHNVITFQTKESGAIVLKSNGEQWRVPDISWIYRVQKMG